MTEVGIDQEAGTPVKYVGRCPCAVNMLTGIRDKVYSALNIGDTDDRRIATVLASGMRNYIHTCSVVQSLERREPIDECERFCDTPCDGIILEGHVEDSSYSSNAETLRH